MGDDQKGNHCTWTDDDGYGIWHTECRRSFELNEGSPQENGMKFCCYCGKQLEVVRGQYSEED